MPRGKKNCPSCSEEISATTKICVKCGYIFIKKTPKKKIVLQGRAGKKVCLKCKNIIGTRTHKCSCGFNFSMNSKHKKRKKNFKHILRYILKKIQKEDYRGHMAEHHRATTNSKKIKKILEAIHSYVSCDPIKLNSDLYLMLIEKISKILGCVTINSFLKNILVDMSRMGYLNRIDGDGNISEGGTGVYIKQISLTKVGERLALLNPENILIREKIHSDASIRLLGREYVDLLLKVMEELEYLSIKEYMYFVSNVGNFEEVIDNVRKYRVLSKLEQKTIDEKITDKVRKMNKRASSKVEQRDIVAWNNEVCQICENLNNIPGFHFFDKKLIK